MTKRFGHALESVETEDSGNWMVVKEEITRIV